MELNYGEGEIYATLLHAVAQYENLLSSPTKKEGNRGWGVNNKRFIEVMEFVKESTRRND